MSLASTSSSMACQRSVKSLHVTAMETPRDRMQRAVITPVISASEQCRTFLFKIAEPLEIEKLWLGSDMVWVAIAS